MTATKNNSLPVRTFGGCTSDGEVVGSLFESDVGDLARASETCRLYFAAMGIYGEPWCERWNGEMWGHWHDQAERFYEPIEVSYMRKKNHETLTEQSPEVRADIAETEEQRQAQARRDPCSCTRVLLTLTVICLGVTGPAYGQTTDPWSTAVGQLATAFTGPIAKGLSLVAIVVGGITTAFSEGNHSRVIGGLVFGCGLALGAASFLSFITS